MSRFRIHVQAPVRRMLGAGFVITALSVVLLGSPPPAAATTNLYDQVQPDVTTMNWFEPNASTSRYSGYAQTVVAGLSGPLTHVILYLSRESLTTKDFVIEIHAGTPNGTLLATSEPVPPAEIPVTPDAT